MRALSLMLLLSGTLHAGDWPQLLGMRRDGIARDEKAITGSADPEIIWERKLGSGHSGPVIVKGRLIIMHRQGDDMVTEALDATNGKPLWKQSYKTDYRDSFGFDNGPRAVPCATSGEIITHGPEGIVQALDPASGKLLWRYDTVAELGSPQGFFGRVCSPLMAEGRVLLNVGGKDGAGIIALDAKTGKLIWKASDDEASCSSPILMPDEPDMSVFFTRAGIAVMQNSDGKLLAEDFFRAEIDASVNAAVPVACGEGRFFFSAAYDVGAGLWQWDKTGRKLTNLWKKNGVLDCHYTTPICHDGHVYGLHGRQESGMSLRCINVAEGKIAWEAPDHVRGGTLLLVGDTLLLTSEEGELWAFKATPDKFDLLRRSQITRAGHRSHAAFSNGVLYARDAEKLVAVKVR